MSGDNVHKFMMKEATCGIEMLDGLLYIMMRQGKRNTALRGLCHVL
jgi:hypothetical protein